MTIADEWVVLDTNIWIFGLRNQPEHPACAELLRHLSRLRIKIPRQILRELQFNLTQEEMRDLFRILNRYPDSIVVQWHKADLALIEKYQRLGSKLGDAAVAAHLEDLGVGTLVSENRDFLQIEGLPFRVLSSSDALRELQDLCL